MSSTDTSTTASAPAESAPINPWSWEEGLQAQQRLWSEWMQSGHLWLSWWVSSLPSLGWPPVGQVLPPAPTSAHDLNLPPSTLPAKPVAAKRVSRPAAKTR
jgi:hypothetical protein